MNIFLCILLLIQSQISSADDVEEDQFDDDSEDDSEALVIRGAEVERFLRRGSITLLLSSVAAICAIKAFEGIGSLITASPFNLMTLLQWAGFLSMLAPESTSWVRNLLDVSGIFRRSRPGAQDDAKAVAFQKLLDDLCSKSSTFELNVLNFQNTKEAALMARIATAEPPNPLSRSNSALKTHEISTPSSPVHDDGPRRAEKKHGVAARALESLLGALNVERKGDPSPSETSPSPRTPVSGTGGALPTRPRPFSRVAFVLDFQGDLDCTAQVNDLRKLVNFVLDSAERLGRLEPPHFNVVAEDQGRSSAVEAEGVGVSVDVIVRIESSGGSVSSYGLAASQLARLAASPAVGTVTACVDKVAASGGYLMASACHQVVVAPFALVGSIGVFGTMLNAQDLAKRVGVRTVELRSGRKKNPLSLIGEVTDEAVADQQAMLNRVHRAFKQRVAEGRGSLVGTGHSAVEPTAQSPPPLPSLQRLLLEPDPKRGMRNGGALARWEGGEGSTAAASVEAAAAAAAAAQAAASLAAERRLRLGRDRDALNAVCDGDVWLGCDAVELGLADAVGTSDDLLRALTAQPPLVPGDRDQGGTGGGDSEGAGAGAASLPCLVIQVRPKEPPAGLLAALKGNLPGGGPTVWGGGSGATSLLHFGGFGRHAVSLAKNGLKALHGTPLY